MYERVDKYEASKRGHGFRYDFDENQTRLF